MLVASELVAYSCSISSQELSVINKSIVVNVLSVSRLSQTPSQQHFSSPTLQDATDSFVDLPASLFLALICLISLIRFCVMAVLLLCLQSSGRIEGCGACYQVRCKIPQFCDDNGAYVAVTDYGEGDRTDFIMSPCALMLNGYLGFENVYCLYVI